jgi:hypothetical protein
MTRSSNTTICGFRFPGAVFFRAEDYGGAADMHKLRAA